MKKFAAASAIILATMAASPVFAADTDWFGGVGVGYQNDHQSHNQNGEDVTEVWFTKELPKLGNGSQVKGIDGFPMEFTVSKQGINITISASKIEKKKVEKSTFEIPEGYEMKTEEEMKKLVPGM